MVRHPQPIHLTPTSPYDPYLTSLPNIPEKQILAGVAMSLVIQIGSPVVFQTNMENMENMAAGFVDCMATISVLLD